MENPEIIYENKDLLVINKPAGLLVHPTPSSFAKASEDEQKTLTSFLLKKYPEIKNVGEDKTRPGIVHRLDKETSGAMIVAKNQSTFEYLKKQFAERKIKKTYTALVAGKINLAKGKMGLINLPIGRSKSNPTLRLASPKARGVLREAITEYKVLEYFDIGCQKSPTSDVCFTLVEAYPKTGRTHQLRAHFKAIGHPVACDKIYARKPLCPPGLSRLFLHASSLELTLPDNSPRFAGEAGSRGRFEAGLPNDLEKVLRALRKEK